jgi:hypothetical protein
MAVCKQRNKPQLHALVVNDLDLQRELSDDVLNDLATEDALHKQFCQLSLNALTTKDTISCLKFRARVKDKTMLILLDSGSSHSFVSQQFMDMAKIPLLPTTPKKV